MLLTEGNRRAKSSEDARAKVRKSAWESRGLAIFAIALRRPVLSVHFPDPRSGGLSLNVNLAGFLSRDRNRQVVLNNVSLECYLSLRPAEFGRNSSFK